MKIILILCLCTLMITIMDAQTEKPKYDSVLAQKYGADNYGMKSYVMVILKTGSADIQDKVKLDTLFRGHLDNINRLADEGKLVIAGPFHKNHRGYRGIFILNVSNFEQAKELLATDPAIKANVFDTELFMWYGSAALPAYLETAKKITKENP